jgi:hypothetical protein
MQRKPAAKGSMTPWSPEDEVPRGDTGTDGRF